jgi:multicomponent Na+:H+ antiporter subunit F
MAIERAYRILLWTGMLTLSVTIFACLFRAILGPRFTDGVVSINLIGTKAVAMIAILTFLLDENYLADIAVVYAMISFLAVVVLSKCYLHKKQIAPRSTGAADAQSKEEEG